MADSTLELPTDQDQTDEEESSQPLPGMLAPIDGPTDPPADLSESVKRNLKKLDRKFSKKDITARRIEVKEARRQRAYWNNDQRIAWDSDRSCWRVFEGGTGDEEEDRGAYGYTLNVYEATGRAMNAVLTQAIPGVRFEPCNPDSAPDITTARAAESLRKVIERDSGVEQFLADAARYMWTDGRTALYVRRTTSAAAYGYKLSEDGVRTPNARENLTAFGVLEVKVPVGAREQSQFSFLQCSFEIDRTQAQAMFPDIADKITPGTTDGDDFERIARRAVMSGSDLLASAENEDETCTYRRTWLRPSTFNAIKDMNEREELLDLYPDGVLIESIGDTFANARNENLDDCWTILHPRSSDSQAAMSLGATIVPIQDLVNEQTDIRQETYSTGQAVTYFDSEVISAEAITEEESRPNNHVPAKPKEGQPISDGFFQSDAAAVPADMVNFFNELIGPILEKVSGISAALWGQASSANTTASGIAQLRDNALGQLGGTYRAFRRAYTQAIFLAVKCACKYRDQDINTSLPAKRGRLVKVSIQVQDLKGEFACYPTSDEGFPQSWSSKRAIVMQLVGMGDSPLIAGILTRPKNMLLLKDYLGIDDLDMPGADIEEKIETLIDELLAAEPIPNIDVADQYAETVAQAQAAGQPPPPKPPFEVLFKASIDPDPIYDDATSEFTAISDWINSPDGQKAKKQKRLGFANVRLYGIAQKAAADQKAQQAAAASVPPPPQPKPPSLSASLKDVAAISPQAAIQALAELGFQVPTQPAPAAIAA